MDYPKTKKVDVTDDYFGVKVVDPYRWLEDDNSEETKEWVRTQNELTDKFFSQISYRDIIKSKIEDILSCQRYWPTLNGNHNDTGIKVGQYYYFAMNNGLDEANIFYRLRNANEEPEVFLNPKDFKVNGEHTSLALFDVSKDCKYMVFSVSKSGSDWKELRVIETDTKKILPDVVKWVKFTSPVFFRDGFFYGGYDKPEEGNELVQANTNQKVFFHKLGTNQNQDRLIFEDNDNPKQINGIQVNKDETYAIIYKFGDLKSCMFGLLDKENPTFKTIIEPSDKDSWCVGEIGNKLAFLTSIDAPKKRLVTIDPNNPDSKNWTTIIPECDNVLDQVEVYGDKLLVSYIDNVKTRLYVCLLDGKMEKEIQLPSIGSAHFVACEDEVLAAFESFTQPPSIIKIDLENAITSVFLSAPPRPVNITVSQEFCVSKDGTKVPMFIIHEHNAISPMSTMLYGYGGFDNPLLPMFSLRALLLAELGCCYVIANLRGGGEFGEDWHNAGKLENKQNVFDDFISCAQYLIQTGYTTKNTLAIHGGSNGGLLVGACMTQKPELFKVALPSVGVMDMLRYHKFTIGWAWVKEYGSSDVKEQFDYIHKYSPIHNLKTGVCYPSTLVTTSDHDDRVVPAHSFKFAATLQEVQSCPNPTLIRVMTDSGHGDKSLLKTINEMTDIVCFMLHHTSFDHCKLIDPMESAKVGVCVIEES